MFAIQVAMFAIHVAMFAIQVAVFAIQVGMSHAPVAVLRLRGTARVMPHNPHRNRSCAPRIPDPVASSLPTITYLGGFMRKLLTVLAAAAALTVGLTGTASAGGVMGPYGSLTTCKNVAKKFAHEKKVKVGPCSKGKGGYYFKWS
jgi:hypothetical protein